MTAAETLYHSIGESMPEAISSQMFGKPCLKLGKKAFVCFFQDEMVFKLDGEAHKEALSLDGSQLFDPAGKGRAMKQWVQVAYDYHEQWPKFAQEAAAYIRTL
ncbi:MAG: hypothetical protein AAF927_06250 [Bacteroidota bacterium]